jgi:uncharacterized repeat protein (TIGR03803 family)
MKSPQPVKFFKHTLAVRVTLAAGAMAALLLAGPDAAAAAGGVSFTTLYSFTNAAAATASLVQGQNGSFYGTTSAGGTNSSTNNYGTIFTVTSGGGYSNLVVFNGANNGAAPNGPLVSAGQNFYGTTSAGGTNNYGTIFSMTQTGVLTTEATFTGANGAYPVGGLVLATNGLYYGTTSSGGANGQGTVFSWSSTAGLTTVVSLNGANDGSSPLAGLVTNYDGNLYGTTSLGGSDGVGTVFQFVPTTGALNPLVSFADTNGAVPSGLVVVGTNMFGTTFYGGTSDFGTIFSVTTTGTLTVLASFDIGNGSNPNGPLLYAADGFLYGTTVQGGSNGMGLVFRVSTNGVVGTNAVIPGGATNGITNLSTMTTVLTFNGANYGAYPQAGLIQAKDYNLYGTTTSGGANGDGNVFKASFPPVITLQPASTNLTLGSSAVFSVQATGSSGSGGLSYQWQLDGTNIANTNLADGESFSGATTASLTVADEVLSDAGSYSVIVSNTVGVVTSSVATLTIPAPSVAFTSPKSNASTSSATVTVLGTAQVVGGVTTDVVTNVMYELNGGTWTSANPMVVNNWAKWSATVTLTAGSNTVMAYGVDPLGNYSPTNSLEVFYVTDTTLTLLTNGYGANKPGFPNKPDTALTTNGLVYTNLVVGTNYTVTAVPSPGYLFANWTKSYSGAPGTQTLTNNPLTFEMEPETAVTANFVANSFIGAKGAYSGLFSVSNTPAFGSAGLIQNLTVGTNGAYSGKLFIGATNYSVTGSFNAYGAATNQLTNGVTLVMNFNFTTTPPQITGSVQQTGRTAFNASLLAEPAATGPASPQYTNSAQYTILIPPQAQYAPGYGCALVTNHLGTTTVKGTLADGTAFSQNVAISQTGSLPIYVAPYTSGGLLWGWLGITNGVPEGELTWIRPAGASGSLFSTSFTNVVAVQSALLTNPPANTPAIPFTSGKLMISNSSAGLVFFVAVSNNNALAKLGSLPTNSLTGSVNPKTGLLSVTFGNVSGKGTTTGAGAVLQASNSAWGFFTNATGAGLIALDANLASNAPVIYQMPASQNFTNQAAYQFLVRAIGASPLSYQWQFDGTNLTNGGTFSGATSPNLTVEPAGLATDAGSYQVIVTNAFGSATSTVATLTIPAPTLTIIAPATSVTNAALTVQGTASDKYGLGGVQWQLNGGGWNTGTTTTNQWTNWSVQVTLQAGSNIFQAYSVDPIGNHSKTNRATVFYATKSTLTLITNGSGTISRNFTGSSLVVGQDYIVTAAPNANNLFSNWIGTGITATNNPLKFLMESNMKLTANFAANPFLSAVGNVQRPVLCPGRRGRANRRVAGRLDGRTAGSLQRQTVYRRNQLRRERQFRSGGRREPIRSSGRTVWEDRCRWRCI